MDVVRRARRPKTFAVVIAAGIIGAIGLTVAHASLSESQDTVHVPYNVVQSAKSVCPHNKNVAFGGFFTNTDNSQQPYAFIDGIEPSGTNKWKVTAHNEAITEATLKSYAYCFKGSKPVIVRGSAKTAQPESTHTTSAQATCTGKHKTLLGGGFSVSGQSSPGNRILITDLKRADNKHTWQAGIVNERDTSTKLKAIAICGKGSAPSEKVITKDIQPFTVGSAVASCPGSKEAVFGGLQAEYVDNGGSNFHAVFPTSLRRSNKGDIRVTGLARASAAQTSKLTSYAYCR